MARSDDAKSTEPTAAEITKFYEDGKDRRYKLLFAMNGGAFTIVKALAGESDSPLFLGSLELWHIGLGMAMFTLVMVADIDAFGVKMRKKDDQLYGPVGEIVLLSIGSLIVAGWVLSAIPRNWVYWSHLLAAFAAVVHCVLVRTAFRWLGKERLSDLQSESKDQGCPSRQENQESR
jgi:hypothetical protein